MKMHELEQRQMELKQLYCNRMTFKSHTNLATLGHFISAEALFWREEREEPLDLLA